jgi:hypothetical protein
MSIDTVIYISQIVLLAACVYMTWSARHALNGLGRGLILLFLLLIARRFNDMLGYLDSIGVLVLSSAVVCVVAYDIFQIWRARDVYALYLQQRRKRIEALESMREKSEPYHGAWNE